MQCAFAVVEGQKVTQTYCKLVNLWLRNASCSFAEFVVAELSLNLRFPALLQLHSFSEEIFLLNVSSKNVFSMKEHAALVQGSSSAIGKTPKFKSQFLTTKQI